MADGDSVMRGFLYMKALIARYGVDLTAELRTLADRLVEQGVFPTWRAAIEGIEKQMGLPITTPLSEEQS